MVEHDQVEEVLSALGSTLGAAEAHGALCGLLCTGTDSRAPGQLKADWFRELLAETGLGAGDVAVHAEGLKLLDGLFESTVKGLNADALDFRLLISDDSVALEQRFFQLSHWCSGFCFGFGLANGSATDFADDFSNDFSKNTATREQASGTPRLDPVAALPADTRELLDDFGNIARSVPDVSNEQPATDSTSELEASDAESDEEALTELEEYVRVGVLLINEEMRPEPLLPTTPISRTLH